MRSIAALLGVLLMAGPAMGQARKFKYFVEVPAQHFVSQPERKRVSQSQSQTFSRPTNASERAILMDFFQQPRMREVQVEIAPFYGSSIMSESGAAGATQKVESVRALGFALRFGLSQNLSLGLSTDYGHGEASGSSLLRPDEASQSFGWSDLKISMQGHQWLNERSYLVYDFGVGISPVNRQLGGRGAKSVNDVYEGNRFSGGHTLNSQIGFQYEMGGGLRAGSMARLSYFEEKNIVAVADSTSFNESSRFSPSIAFLAEKSFHGSALGGELRHEWMSTAIAKTQDASNALVTSVYFGTYAAENLWFKPVLTYATMLEKPNDRFNQHDQIEARLVMRMSL